MEKVLAILRASLSDDQFKVDHPRMSLEDFFLDVVNKAQSESVETYGARSGGHIAEYLSADAEEDSARELLASLTGKDKEPEKPVEPVAEAPKIDTKTLDDLSDDLLRTKTPEKDEPAAPKIDLSEANEKLKDILSSRDAK